MAGIQLSGLASGLDTSSIIAQLMAVERQPRTRLERDQAAVTARQTALKDILAKLKTLKTSATDLQSAALWTSAQSVSSANPARVGGSLTGTQDVMPGTYDVSVSRLATGQQETWSWKQIPTAKPLTITDSGGTAFTVNVAANATVDDAVAQINADSTLPVTAMNLNGDILFRSKTTGATAGSFTVSGNNLNAQTSLTAGQDASFQVNGTAYTSATNVDTAAVPGLQLTLSGITGTSPVSLTVTAKQVDKDAVATKLKAFVDAYNAASDLMRAKLTEKRVPNPQNNVDAGKGVLFGDQGVSSIASNLRSALMDPVSGIGNAATLDELREIGVTTGAAAATVIADNVNGKLTFDQAAFDKAWAADPSSVERLLRGSGSTGGFAQRMDGLLTPLTTTGGLFDGRVSAADSELSRLKTSLATMDDRLSRKEAALRKQFTALETAMAKAQQQQVNLSSRLAGLG